MTQIWYPDFDDIMSLFVKLQQKDSELKDANLMNENAIKSILNKVKYGLPFKKTSFMEKTAILWHDITREHHFSNGNKRMGFWAMSTFLEMNGYHLKKIHDDLIVALCVEIAEGKQNIEKITVWLMNNSEKI
ncbi:MAG: type II toxin-antitoxin system death-on-curing family toxin [Promethearchaeota archaeon]|nr:MAG: type II toxin-antitoxin system death-on-curing family toxin [Candidatus Lokiarchaeota archaeon]